MQPTKLLLWRMTRAGIGFVWVENAALRSATVGSERRRFWAAWQHDTQNLASSIVYLIEFKREIVLKSVRVIERRHNRVIIVKDSRLRNLDEAARDGVHRWLRALLAEPLYRAPRM
jgi:hypothetical protein